MKQDYLCKLAEISLNIANVVDRQGANDDCSLADSLGMGYRALSSYLQGVKAIVDIIDSVSDDDKNKIKEFVSALLNSEDDEQP